MTKHRNLLPAVLLIIILIPVTAAAWGEKGHAMCARIAARHMPGEMPAFFRKSVERLAYLSSEPDRWRASSIPALSALNAPDHYFDLEAWGADPLPATRYDLVILSIKKNLIHYDPLASESSRGALNNDRFVSDVGTAPYAVAETAAKLISNFREWRDSADNTEAARVVRGQIEDSIIYLSGVLAHYVTDLGNPLHCTVHYNGWAVGYSNPDGFPVGRAAEGIHSRFEADFVNAAVEETDIEPLLSPFHRLASWLPDMEAFVRRNNAFVRRVYALDKAGAFGSGHEPGDAKPFLAARLADSAAMLRDVWSTAWLISGEEWLNDRVAVFPRAGKTVLELLRERYRVETADHDGIAEVTGIGNRRNGIDGRKWRMYVNNQPNTSRSVNTYAPAAGDRIDFRFEKASRL